MLANSYKNGRRCLAGVDDDDHWVRPVADATGEGIAPDRLTIDGRTVWPGDVVDLELGAAVPLASQSENILLSDRPLVFQAPIAKDQLLERLERVSVRIPSFASNSRKSVEDSEYDNGLAPESLALLRTGELKMKWKPRPTDGVLRPRAIFMTPQGGWDLPYTGEQWEEFPPRLNGAEQTYGPAYVTVSVGGLMSGGSTHWVLAAGVLPAV